MLFVMRSYMQTCHFILLNNNCLFINGTKLVKTSRLSRLTCIVCGIRCFELNYILLGVRLRCSYFCSQKRKMAESIWSVTAISFLPSFWLYFNERIYEYGDKVKVQQPVEPYHQKKSYLIGSPRSSFTVLLISRKNVDFKL